MAQKMRNPGYMRAMQTWEADCAVLFNGIDFGPNLLYRKLRFLPGALKRVQTNVQGMPGRLDDSALPNGYCVPDNLSATLELWVRDPKAWGQPVLTDDGYMSPEARFLAQISDPCRLDFYSSNGFYLNAVCSLTKYQRFDLGFLIVLKLDCEPYWWEDPPQAVEFSVGAQGTINLFDPDTATVYTSQLPAGQTCEWNDAPSGAGGWYILHADPDRFAEVVITGLNTAKNYRFGMRNIYSHGVYMLFDQSSRRVYNEFTGVSTLTVKLISKADAAQAVGFTDVCLYEVGAGSATGEITTLDAPLHTIRCTASAAAEMIIDGERVKLPADSDVPVYGLNIPPRTTVPVQFVAAGASHGFISYQRGARSCTL